MIGVSLPEDAVWSDKNSISPIDMIGNVINRSLAIISCLDAYATGEGKFEPDNEKISSTLWQLEANLNEISKISSIWFEEEKRWKKEGSIPGFCSKV